MASESAHQGGQTLSAILRFLRIFILNTWRRLLIVSHYTMICFHQQRLRRAWRVLGKHIHEAVEAGEVNPMLSDSVQEKLTRAQVVKGTKERHYQVIAGLREKIRASRAEEAPPAGTAEAPGAAEAAPGTAPESKTGGEEGRV
jgi:hypothetical protein